VESLRKVEKGKTFPALKRKLLCFHSPLNSIFIKLIARSDKIDLCGDRRQLYADAVPNGSVADRKRFIKIYIRVRESKESWMFHGVIILLTTRRKSWLISIHKKLNCVVNLKNSQKLNKNNMKIVVRISNILNKQFLSLKFFKLHQ